MSREVLIEWSICRFGMGITDPTYAIEVSKTIGATGVLLRMDFDLEKNELGRIAQSVNTYKAAGFTVYLNPLSSTLLTPSEISGLLNLNVDGIQWSFWIGADSNGIPSMFDSAQSEPALIALANACKAVGKKCGYYHGDATGNVNVVMLSQAGLIVRAWWFPPWWKPGTWDISPIWAEMCIWRGIYTTSAWGHPETTALDIHNWYNTLGRKPEAILWEHWLSTENEIATEEQIQAMKEVSKEYLPTPIEPTPSNQIVLPLIILAVVGVGIVSGLYLRK